MLFSQKIYEKAYVVGVRVADEIEDTGKPSITSASTVHDYNTSIRKEHCLADRAYLAMPASSKSIREPWSEAGICELYSLVANYDQRVRTWGICWEEKAATHKIRYVTPSACEKSWLVAVLVI
jgi:hypothetical protein